MFSQKPVITLETTANSPCTKGLPPSDHPRSVAGNDALMIDCKSCHHLGRASQCSPITFCQVTCCLPSSLMAPNQQAAAITTKDSNSLPVVDQDAEFQAVNVCRCEFRRSEYRRAGLTQARPLHKGQSLPNKNPHANCHSAHSREPNPHRGASYNQGHIACFYATITRSGSVLNSVCSFQTPHSSPLTQSQWCSLCDRKGGTQLLCAGCRLVVCTSSADYSVRGCLEWSTAFVEDDFVFKCMFCDKNIKVSKLLKEL